MAFFDNQRVMPSVITDADGTPIPVDGNGRLQVAVPGSVTVTGPLTDGQLRASPVPVTYGALLDSEGVQYVRQRDRATFTAVAPGVVLGNGKSLLSLANANGSQVVVKIWRIYLINTQTGPVTGVAAEFHLRRFVGHSAGLVLTPEAHDLNDVLSGSITARTGATLTSESSSFIDRRLWATDDWGPGTLDTESSDHAIQSSGPIWNFEGFNVPRPITIRANQGLSVRCNTNTTAGTFDVVMVFTAE